MQQGHLIDLLGHPPDNRLDFSTSLPSTEERLVCGASPHSTNLLPHPTEQLLPVTLPIQPSDSHLNVPP